MRALPLALSLLFVTSVFAGCIVDDDDPGSDPAGDLVAVTVVDEDGTAVPFAKVVTLDDSLEVLSLHSTGLDGQVSFGRPEGTAYVGLVWGNKVVTDQAESGSVTFEVSGTEAWTGERNPQVYLASVDDDTFAALGLTPTKIHDFGSVSYPVAAGTSCLPDPTTDPMGTVGALGAMDCGLSEPTLEVAGDGTLYYSAVCCIGGAPPVWVSRDDGETWQDLETTGGQREAFGIEGDFAIDDAGNVYFFDIELANIQLTAWDKDGAHLHTVHWPSPPLVDRPWVRAEGDGTVYIAYNQGIGQSTFMRSTDHGLTFPATDWTEFPFNFANPARGAAEGELWVTGERGTDLPVWHTTDGGATWTQEDAGETPGEGSFGNRVIVVDTAGTPYLFFDDRAKDGEFGDEKDDVPGGYHVYYTYRDTEGGWSDPIMVGPAEGSHYFPWPAAGGPGKVAVAWYGTLDDTAGPNDVEDGTPWYLFLAASLDADTPDAHWQTIVADPDPLLTGQVNRRLLDFVQTDIGPDGAIHVAYAHDPDDDGKETTVYLQTAANLPLVDPTAGIFNGPHGE